MAQKIAIIILTVALVLVSLGIFVFVVKNQPAKQAVVETKPIVETAPVVKDKIIPKAPPTEEEIEQEIKETKQQIKEAGGVRNLTPEEIDFIINPRQEAIKKLSQ